MKFLVIFLAWMALLKLPLPQLSWQSQGAARFFSGVAKLPFFNKLPAFAQYFSLVLLPTLLVAMVFYYVEPILWGLPALALELVLVIYVLLHADIQRHIDTYQAKIQAEDFQGAYLCAQQSLGIELEEGVEASRESITAAVIKTLLYRWFEFFFLMLFWYVIADVAGMVLVWLSLQYAKHDKTNALAAKILYLLEAIPVRLLALTYGLAGNLVKALPVWNRTLVHWQQAHDELLYSVASSALDASAAPVEITSEWHRLHRYSVSIWLVIIAVATLGGWLL